MPWFKVDDKLHDHRKARAAGLAAMGLWTLAGSWCADNLTDGFIPASVAARWDRQYRRLAEVLVRVGLWEPAEQNGEPGWVFHAWEAYQPVREEVEGKRQAARERMRTIRTGPRSSTPVRANTTRTPTEHRAKFPRSSRGVRDARPDPSRPAAAAAARPPLPPPVEILRTRLEAARLVVRWDTLTAEDHAELTALIETHGDGPLVASAVRSYRADQPPAFARAWLGQWRNLTRPGDLRAVQPTRCDEHQLPEPCRGCAADVKAGGA